MLAKGRLSVSEPFWGLWFQLKTWWESSASCSPCPAWGKVRNPPRENTGPNPTGPLWDFYKGTNNSRGQWLILSYECTDGMVVEPDMSAGFCPDHKAAMVLFLDRVYGIEDQNFLFHLLEVGFLPDLRAAASLDTVRTWCWPLCARSGHRPHNMCIHVRVCCLFSFSNILSKLH